MMKNYFLFWIVFLLLCSSCSKEKFYAQEEKFQEMLDNLEFECLDTAIVDCFKARIRGQEVCYFHGVNGVAKEIASYESIFISDDNQVINMQKIVWGIVSDSTYAYQNWIEFESPIFQKNILVEHYLDSIFDIEYHPLKGLSDENGFKVTLKMFDPVENGSGGISYPISSQYGYHNDNEYLQFLNVTKEFNDNKVIYDISMNVIADLYYYEDENGYNQYGKKGLWGRLENGILRMKVKIN